MSCYTGLWKTAKMFSRSCEKYAIGQCCKGRTRFAVRERTAPAAQLVRHTQHLPDLSMTRTWLTENGRNLQIRRKSTIQETNFTENSIKYRRERT